MGLQNETEFTIQRDAGSGLPAEFRIGSVLIRTGSLARVNGAPKARKYGEISGA